LAATAALAFSSALGIGVALDDNLGILPFEEFNHILPRIPGNEHRALEEQNLGGTSRGEHRVTARGRNDAQVPPVFLFGFLNEVGYTTVLERLGGGRKCYETGFTLICYRTDELRCFTSILSYASRPSLSEM